MILLASRQAKNLSLPIQHCWREVRSGAIEPPSAAFLGAGSVDDENQPIVRSNRVSQESREPIYKIA